MRSSPCCTGCQRGQHPHHGGLARAVGPEQAHRFAGPNLQRHIVDRGELAVAVGQVPAVDRHRQRSAHDHRSCSRRVIVSRTCQSLCQSLDLVVTQFARAPRPAGSPRGAGRVDDLLGGLGEPQLADPAVGFGPAVRTSKPLATSLETSVEAVLATSPSSAAAALTEMPGRRPTSHSSSDCDSVSRAESKPRPADRRSCRRNLPTTRDTR